MKQMLIGKKIGMTQVFDDKGSLVSVTAIDISDNKVLTHKTKEKDGYTAVVLGKDVNSNPTKAESKKYSDQEYPAYIKELRTVDSEYNIENILGLISNSKKVNVTAETKGKGFQGVMRAHGMKGGPKTHGQSTKPRSIGSIAPGQTFAHVMKGRRMARKVGNWKVTYKNLKVISFDKDSNVLYVKGSFAGNNKSYCLISF